MKKAHITNLIFQLAVFIFYVCCVLFSKTVSLFGAVFLILLFILVFIIESSESLDYFLNNKNNDAN